MQRTEEAKLRQQLEEEEKREIDEAHWVIDNIEDAEEWVTDIITHYTAAIILSLNSGRKLATLYANEIHQMFQ